nr:MAG TPA: hypothetical protein [Caudoviricetes sp.]
MKRIDLTGQRFGRLTVTEYDHSEHDGAHWLCKCDCGTEKVIAGYLLRNGATKSCGCLKSDASRAALEKARAALAARPRNDLTGQRFGRLVVLGLADVPDRKGFIFWRVRCDCGTEKIVMQNNLVFGRTKSCGCLSREMRSERAARMRMCRKLKSDVTGKTPVRETTPKQTAVEVKKRAKAAPEQPPKICKPGRPTKSDAEFFKKHGCSVCADNKSCDMTICKYEKELIK